MTLPRTRYLTAVTAALVTLITAGAAPAAQATSPSRAAPTDATAAGPGQQTIWRGDFDAARAGWTVRTEGAPADWRGWTFTERDAWFAAAAPAGIGCDPEQNAPLDQRCFLDQRNQFSRSRGFLAVADNGVASARGATVDGANPVSTTLTSPVVPVGGQRQLELVFSSHYRQAHKAVGRVTVSFDGGPESEILRYSAARISANGGQDVISGQEVVPVKVPAKASTAVFRFGYASNQPRLYWAVDDVLVRTPMAPLPAGVTPTTIQVLSDIQHEGLPYLDGTLDLLRRQAPKSKALLVVGDIISGPREQTQEQQVAEYDEVSAIFADRDRIPTVLPVLGNHDVRSRVLTLQQQVDNFLTFGNKWGAEIDKTYYEKVVGGVPIIVLGPEAGVPAEEQQDISDAQVAFLGARLAHWSGRGRQVLVLRHYPFAWTVSGTYGNFYGNGPRDVELENIVGRYPNAIYLSGHTHWSPYRSDWAVRTVTDGGHPDGYTAINTGALAMEFAPSPTDPWDEDSATDRPESPTALTVSVYPDRTVVLAYDALTGEQINQVEVANPLYRG
ncbi:metallophosphoesterase [Micromonospora sp. NPDC049523]|uniref:metallophosphoesterase family protein n=1 Tax=Micromonospora sp. NPDC049523 TaxID=3155921 RepID=UPI003437B5DA